MTHHSAHQFIDQFQRILDSRVKQCFRMDRLFRSTKDQLDNHHGNSRHNETNDNQHNLHNNINHSATYIYYTQLLLMQSRPNGKLFSKQSDVL